MATSEPYQVALFKDLMIPMRDGVRLAADIYRPARDGEVLPGPFPALLVRTSYDKQAEWLIDEVADCFTPRGFVLVLQDLRGRHRSEGTGQYFHTVNETAGTDGYDTVEWIAAQPWSNGRVGAMGSSHLALVQTHMALYRPPHLRAIWPDVSPTNSYAQQVRWGGAMQLHMFGALFLHAYDAQEIRDDSPARQRVLQGMERMGDWVRRTPFQPGGTPLAAVPNLEKIMLDYYRRGAYDEFWRLESNDFEQHFRRHADIPGTYSGGWYDPFAIATTRYYAAMTRQNRSPQRLVMGPWTHGGMRAGYSFAGDVDFGSEAAWGRDRYNRERLCWFVADHHKTHPVPDRGRQRGNAAKDPVESLLDETRTHEQEQNVRFGHAELTPESAPGFEAGLTSVPLDSRRQRMKTVGRGAIDGPERGVLARSDRKNARLGIWCEHRPLELRVVPVPGRQPVKPRTLNPCLALETGIGGIVDVETRHLVHAYDEVDWIGPDMLGDLNGEPVLADMAADAPARYHDGLDALQMRARPFKRVDSHVVPPLSTRRDDLRQVPRGSAVGKELEDGERDTHDRSCYRPATFRGCCAIASSNADHARAGSTVARHGGQWSA